MSSNIVLIGFMGSGKTTVGQALAKKLKKTFIDMDKEIEKEENRSINEIFASNGESYFRETESRYLQSLSQEEECVISTGGGVILSEDNRNKLKELGKVVFLHADINHIVENVKKDTNRPLLHTDNYVETIKMLLDQREDKYLQTADIIIQASGKTVADIVAEIFSLL